MPLHSAVQCSMAQCSIVRYSSVYTVISADPGLANAKFINYFLSSVRLTTCQYLSVTLYKVTSHQTIMDFCLCFSTSYVKATCCCHLRELVPVQGSEDGGSRLLLVICCCDSYFTCSQVGQNTRTMTFCAAEDMGRASRKVACC